MNSVRQLASVTQTAARSVAGRHVRNLSTSASPSGTGVPAGVSGKGEIGCRVPCCTSLFCCHQRTRHSSHFMILTLLTALLNTFQDEVSFCRTCPRITLNVPLPISSLAQQTFAGKCRCWPNPPCHHHATGACGYSQFECDGGAGGGCSPAQYHQAAASGSSSIQTSTSQILAGASQAVGRQCQTLLNGMLFDTDRAAAMTGKDRSFSYSR
jgi:hypothetical protein